MRLVVIDQITKEEEEKKQKKKSQKNGSKFTVILIW